MAKSEKDAPLATQQAGGALVNLDDLYAEMGHAGLEHVSQNEITLPQAKLLQPTSPAVADGKGKPGDIFNTMTEENYGPSVKFIPLFFWLSRIHFNGKELNSGIECSSKNGVLGSRADETHGGGVCAKCPHSQWTPQPGAPDLGPECLEFKNVLAIPVLEGVSLQDSSPVVFSGKRKAIVPINKFLTNAQFIRVGGRPVPFFASEWIMTSVQTKNDKGTFYVPSFKRAEFVADREVLMYLKGMYDSMKQAQESFVVHDQSATDETEQPAATTSTDY